MGWYRKLHLSHSWEIAIGIFAAVLLAVLFRVVLRLVTTRFEKIVKRTKGQWDDLLIAVVERTHSFYLFLLALVLVESIQDWGPRAHAFAHRTFEVGTLIQIGLWGVSLIDGGFFYGAKKAAMEKQQANSLFFIRLAIKGIFYVVLILTVLHSFGVNITALVASLGVGGVAVALAVQNILGDLFASLSIVLDRPFVVGDFVAAGDDMGTIEKIGLKTTRVRSLTGEQLIFPNSNLLQSRLHNFRRMQEKRVVFSFGVPYATPIETVRAIPGLIREVIEKKQKVRLERTHFSSLSGTNDFSYRFETVWWVLSADYNFYMDVQQAIYLEILEGLEKMEVSLAVPVAKVEVPILNSGPDPDIRMEH